MTVFFIGAGPGDPDLITVKGARLVEQCPVVLYTGSLVPKEVVARANKDALVLSSADMDLEETTEVLRKAHEEGKDVARVHTGDPSIYGAIAEQIRRLDDLGIDWKVIPGVSSFQASAAALGQELTLPEVCQTIILTRMPGRTPVPEKENILELAKHEATMCIYLSISMLKKLCNQLKTIYPADYPIAVVEKASWPEQRVIRGTITDIHDKVKELDIRATAMIVVGKVLGKTDFNDSKLYDKTFSHDFRTARCPE
ncbi:precorrin-4 C(11)-methyltransferase [Parendozoicomonas haliclonae]|uniref:Cobalt-precorrin-4 C(11)-methyltransferase n=1 Tax=Parendozoicomonas haliclonae TaxID=1960125 RepID=A0A1X7ALZ3_9GAMM|nr:precorrin-4 C(11)-methyltransferase [Parendozoicomonas haliclonae]SMA48824.1 Cobalt-precorrin-4 C(11)-methyltransferase [Parendozoicomonas haliclonae]